MKPKNIFLKLQNALKPLSIVSVLSASLLMPLYAINVDPGGSDCDGEKPCPTCEDPDAMIPDDEECESSFNMQISVGFACVSREGNFLNYSRAGLIEGQEGKGYYRGFDELRQEILNTNNYTNRVQQRLSIVHGRIDEALYDPSIFSYSVLSGTEYIESEGALKQILTDSAFTDIEVFDDGFIVRTWPKEALTNTVKVGNLYVVPTIAPVKTTRFTNPDHPNLNNRLALYRYENFSGTSPHYEVKLYTQTNADQMIAETYEGQDLTGSLLKRLTLNYLERGSRPWDYTYERIIEQASNINGVIGNLVTVTHNREVYQDFSTSTAGNDRNGKRLMSKITAFGTAEAQTTTYDYYDEPTNKYINGRLKSKLNPDGSWEYWEYVDSEGNATALEIKYSSWKDVTLADYQNGMKQETIITKSEVNRTVTIQGQQISKEKYTTSVDPATGNLSYLEQMWSGSEWATETTCFGPSGSDLALAGRPICRTFADGTAETIEYESTGDDLIVTISRGANTTGTVAAPVITEGTRTVSIYNSGKLVISKEVYDIETGLLISSEFATEFDASGRITKKIYNANPNDYELMQYGCCGLEFSQDRTGATKTFFRDNLKRVYRVVSQASTADTPVITNTDINGLTTKVTRTDGTTTLLVSETTKSLGGLTTNLLSPDADGDGIAETSSDVIVYNSVGGQTNTMTYADGTISSTTTFIDGSVKSITDQAGYTSTMDKGVHSENGGGLYMVNTAANGTQWTKTYNDQLGRNFKMEYPDGAIATRSYYLFDETSADLGARGKLAATIDADENAAAGTGTKMTYSYCTEGHRCTTITALPDGQSMTTVNDHDVVDDPDLGVSVRNTSITNGVLTSTNLHSGDGYASKTITFNEISTSTRTVPVDGAWTVTSTTPDGQINIQTYIDGEMVETKMLANDGSSVINSTQYTYDNFSRNLTATDSRTGVTTINGYLENGSTIGVTTNAGVDTTSYSYDVMGRTVATSLPDGSTTYTSYTDRGETLAVWGSQTYARLYQYDALGRMSELRTYQDLAHDTEPTTAITGFALTSWLYDAQRGWLTEKNYDGETDDGIINPDYTYTASGRLATRTWERGVVTTYAYDQGQLSSVVYGNDPTNTPNISYTYDNFGRKDQVMRDGVLHADYDYNGELLLSQEHLNIDTDTSRVLTRTYDSINRPDSVRLGTLASTSSEYWNQFTYDTAGRLFRIRDRKISNRYYSYYYLNNAAATVSRIQLAHGLNASGSTFDVTGSYVRAFEPNRNVISWVGIGYRGNQTGNRARYDYQTNELGQRTRVDRSGALVTNSGSWDWNYNERGELESAEPSWDDNLSSQYTYDGIGNRIDHEIGTGAGLQQLQYTANSKNQYSQVGLYDYMTSTSYTLAPSYDLDGNMTSGPLPVDPGNNATLAWDAENRLVAITKADNTIIRFTYDYQGRRMSKEVDGASTSYYIYDGWNMLSEYTQELGSGAVSLECRYVWGLDLVGQSGGSAQGAGGVGGLLAIQKGSISYLPSYDANGNVTELVQVRPAIGDGFSNVGHYSYDAYGNLVTAASDHDGSDYVNQNPYRFSTKYRDEETGLYYYGYRYYDPVTGRWPSRDPIVERGGVNVYGFVGNDTLSSIDVLGMAEFSDCQTKSASLPTLETSSSVGSGRLQFSVSEEVCKCCDGKEGEFTKSIKGKVDAYLFFSRADVQFKKGSFSIWGGRRVRGTISGSGSVNGQAESCDGRMSYSINVSISGSLGVDFGGVVKFSRGAVNYRVGASAGGTATFTAWGITAACDESGCRNPRINRGGIGGAIGLTFHAGVLSGSVKIGASDLFSF